MALQAEWKNKCLKVGLRNKESSVVGEERGRGQAKELRLQRPGPDLAPFSRPGEGPVECLPWQFP